MKYRLLGACVLASGLLLGGCANPAGDDPKKSANADLKSLSTSAGTLTPAFAADTMDYTVDVANSVTTITLTGIAADPNAMVGGFSGVAVDLQEGPNDLLVIVIAQDGTTKKQYDVTVNRAAPLDPPDQTNADLNGITLSAGRLCPLFDADTTDYVVLLTNDVASLTVTGTAADAEAVVGGDSGTAVNLAIAPEANQITLSVTAPDGETTKDYVVTAYRNGAAPADYPATGHMGIMKGVPKGAFRWYDEYDTIVYEIGVLKESFRISRYEVTRAQWRTIMGGDATDPSYTNPAQGSTSEPVRKINWYQAVAFCNLLSLADGLDPVYAVTGVDFSTLEYGDIPTAVNAVWDAVSVNWAANGYRLPTYMERMWAALGADDAHSRAFAGSTGDNDKDDFVWHGDIIGAAQPVGGKNPNALGLYDMSGNVQEWMWNRVDTSGPGYGPVQPVIYSDDVDDRGRGDATGDYRSVGDDSFTHLGTFNLWNVDYSVPSSVTGYVGLRVVRN